MGIEIIYVYVGLVFAPVVLLFLGTVIGVSILIATSLIKAIKELLE